LPPGVRGVELVRASGDGPRALLVARDDRLEVVDPGTGETTAALARGEARIFAWCVAPDAGGAEPVFLLRDGGEVARWAGGDAAPEIVLTDGAANLPSGVTHLPFARDLDGDGRVDVVVPTADGLDLWRAAGDRYEKTASVRHEVDVSLSADGPDDDDGELEQRVRIPRFDVEDMNGDGVPDLVFSDDDHVRFFWSGPDGRLPEEPTFTLDLEEIRTSLPARSRDVIDTENLLNLLESTVSHLSRDFDGDGFADLLLRRGKKVSVYAGGPSGIDRSTAKQVLRTGGNLLSAVAFDDDGDGKDDLALLLMSDLSLGQLLFWLVAGGEIELDLYVYAQEGALRFARKPTRRRTLVIELPSVTSLISDFEEQVDGIADELTRLPVAGDFDGDGRTDDAARRLPDGSVGLYRDAADGAETDWSKQRAWRSVVAKFDRAANGGERFEDDLLSLLDWAPLPGRELALALDGRTADRVVALEARDGTTDVLFALDVDGAPGDELVVVRGAGPEAPVRVVIVGDALGN
ncbi:MAG: FG-GAP repeat domain-containing protein, partial [Planctomycetota bacterium JB042]